MHGLTTVLGEPRTLSALKAEGASDAQLRELAALGLRAYREFERPVPDVASAVVRESLASAGIDPADVDALLVASACSSMLAELEPIGRAVLRTAGLSRADLVGVGLQGCATFIAALRMARALVDRDGLGHAVVLVVDAARSSGFPRLSPGWTVHGDAAAACAVSRAGGRFLLGPSQFARPGEDRRVAHAAGFRANVRDHAAPLVRALLAREGKTVGDMAACVTNNYNELVSILLASALGVERERIYDRSRAVVGHCFAADIVTNLRILTHDPALGGGLFVLFGFSAHSMAAMLVEAVV